MPSDEHQDRSDVEISAGEETEEDRDLPPPNRRARWIFAIIGTVFVVWQIFTTEKRVAQLRADGFGEVVIESTRNHAYFPIIGALFGSLLFIGIYTAVKRALSEGGA